MLKLGQFNELRANKETAFGLYLESEVGEILLPKKYIPQGTKIGDIINVFIYKDSEDRYIATTLIPKAQVEEFAYLEVRDINKYGAFLDWGLEKDLFVPYNEQKTTMIKGEKYIVRVCVDKVTSRIIASQKINKFIETENISLTEGEEVDLMIYEFNDLGIKVIINDKYFGLLYKNEVYRNLETGEKIKGYIKKVREDNKLDVTIKGKGYEEREESRNVILKKLEENKGFLPLTDKSEAERIKTMLQMSKKTFKKAIGGLYKDKIITLSDEGIHLKK